MAERRTTEAADEFVLFSQKEHRALDDRTVERNVRGKLIPYATCLIRGKEFQLRPEERTRQLWLARLIDALGYAPSRIAVEYPINSNQDIAKIIPSGVSPFYLAAYLSSRFGQTQIHRLPVGSVQQHVFLWMIERLKIPRFSQALEYSIAQAASRSPDAGVNSRVKPGGTGAKKPDTPGRARSKP